jgi:competence protein ComEA
VEPRVPETNAARALLWTGVAVASLLALRGPSAPGALALVREASTCRLGEAGSGAPCACDALPADARVALGLPQSLNRASAEDLERVPGLGPARARAIAAERTSGGAFESLEALSARVPGIGPGTVDRIRPHLFAVGPDPACGVGDPS